MPNPAISGASPQGSSAKTGGAGANPFMIATNLYAEKNLQGAITSQILGTTAIPGGGSINAGQYLRGIRLMLRTVTVGAGGTAANADGPWSVFSQLDLVNVDGSEILYNMSGFSHFAAQKYFRPWLQSPDSAYDYQVPSATSAGSGTLFLQPEIRWGACCLANTDTRSQYRFDYNLNTAANVGGSYSTAPTISLTPYMDAWAQPDSQDLQGTPNQPVPPGVNLQLKRRHQIFTLNATGSDNVLLSTLTGNALRGMMLICRTSGGVRVDGFTDPFYWQLDNRSLGRLNPDILRQWSQDFYSTLNRPNASAENIGATGAYTGAGSGDTGVYVFPRFIEPGELYGQGWLYTANNTKLQFESVTSSGAGSNATAELVSDEVYPVGPVDPQLVDI